MGFKVKHPILRLTFDKPELEGLEVRARSIGLGAYLSLARMAELSDKETLDAEDMAQLGGPFKILAQALVSWNLEEEDGTPIPATFEGIMSQDMGIMFDVLSGWMDAIASVSIPLDRAPKGTKPLEALSLQMEAL